MTLRNLVIACVMWVMVVAMSSARDAWVVRPDGIGPVKIGMTFSQLNAVLHERFSLPESKEERRCFYVASAKHPGLSFMIEDGRVTRLDVDSPEMATDEGIRVGDTETRALEVYGRRLKVEPHHYTGEAGGHYLTLMSADGQYGIRFETDQGRITRFYAGWTASISYVEGCL